MTPSFKLKRAPLQVRVICAAMLTCCSAMCRHQHRQETLILVLQAAMSTQLILLTTCLYTFPALRCTGCRSGTRRTLTPCMQSSRQPARHKRAGLSGQPPALGAHPEAVGTVIKACVHTCSHHLMTLSRSAIRLGHSSIAAQVCILMIIKRCVLRDGPSLMDIVWPVTSPAGMVAATLRSIWAGFGYIKQGELSDFVPSLVMEVYQGISQQQQTGSRTTIVSAAAVGRRGCMAGLQAHRSTGVSVHRQTAVHKGCCSGTHCASVAGPVDQATSASYLEQCSCMPRNVCPAGVPSAASISCMHLYMYNKPGSWPIQASAACPGCCCHAFTSPSALL